MATGRKERAHAPLPPKIGRYEVLVLLGEGGMGRVCLARVIGPGGFERLVAVKLLHEHLGRRRGFVDMFLDEARVAARIRHPNVVPVLEVGEDAGQHFIAMDYVSGETLARAMNRLHKHDRRLPSAVAAHLVWGACEGLHAAHELLGPTGESMGVVHRDVSPENLIIGYDGTLRVTDFGVVKFDDQSWETAPGTWKGKAGYLAPELIEGRPIDRRADVFGLGIVLWESTLGRPLFRSENPFQSAELIRSNKVPAPTSIDPSFAPELETIVLKALAQSPDDRYPTARALGEDLRMWIASTGHMVAPLEIETFMGALFAERKKRRVEMERRASSMQLPREPKPAALSGTQLEPIRPESLLDKSGSKAWDRNNIEPPSTAASDGASPVAEERDELADDPLLDALVSNISDHNAGYQPPPRALPRPPTDEGASASVWASEGAAPRETRARWPLVVIALIVIGALGAIAFFALQLNDPAGDQDYRRVSKPETDPHGTKAPQK